MSTKNKETILQVPADLVKVETQSKGTLRLVFKTQEGISNELRSRMMALHERYGWLSFLAEEEIQPEDVINLPKLSKPIEEVKSPSQILRAVLYRLWEQKGKPTKTFEEYYRMQMEYLINQFKEKLT